MKLELQDICHSYGKNEVLKGVNCTLNNGVYGLLGPNGAGKTTLINIIVKLLSPTSGDVVLDGKSFNEYKAEYYDFIGFLPQYPRFYPGYTAQEFLFYMAACKGISKDTVKPMVESLFKFVNLQREENKKIGEYSGGMKQRLGIAQALLGNPKILILDEPTAGLDPRELIRFRNLISKISENRIVILATHIVSDVENIAKSVLILKDGCIDAARTPKSLIDDMHGKVWEYDVEEKEVDSYLTKESVIGAKPNGTKYTVREVNILKPHEAAISVEPNLEDVYLYEFGGTDI